MPPPSPPPRHSCRPSPARLSAGRRHRRRGQRLEQAGIVSPSSPSPSVRSAGRKRLRPGSSGTVVPDAGGWSSWRQHGRVRAPCVPAGAGASGASFIGARIPRVGLRPHGRSTSHRPPCHLSPPPGVRVSTRESGRDLGRRQHLPSENVSRKALGNSSGFAPEVAQTRGLPHPLGGAFPEALGGSSPSRVHSVCLHVGSRTGTHNFGEPKFSHTSQSRGHSWRQRRF